MVAGLKCEGFCSEAFFWNVGGGGGAWLVGWEEVRIKNSCIHLPKRATT